MRSDSDQRMKAKAEKRAKHDAGGTGTARCHNRVSKYFNSSDYRVLKRKLVAADDVPCSAEYVKDVIFRGKSGSDHARANGLREKYIVRFPKRDADEAILIKECTDDGGKVKEVTQPISGETARKIISCSTRWLCASVSPLLHELGVKMTTDGLRPDTVMRFLHESFQVDSRVSITADSDIALCEYGEAQGDADPANESLNYESVDRDVCIVQVNYERIIPERISALIGIKAT